MTIEKTSIKARSDPRVGLYPKLKQYRATCAVCGWASQWFKYEQNAQSSRDLHVARRECP